jgi:hypothetical protein
VQRMSLSLICCRDSCESESLIATTSSLRQDSRS